MTAAISDAVLPSLNIETNIAEPIAAIAAMVSGIEGVFGEAGSDLSKGYAVYDDLNRGLVSLTHVVSAEQLDSVSGGLRHIADRLRTSAEALPREGALLVDIAARNAEASALLRRLVKNIKMVTIIARSARIEAATVDDQRADFLNFTREVFDLAKRLQVSIEDCARDHGLLSAAVDNALSRQAAFERDYSEKMQSVARDLVATYAEIRDLQSRGGHLAEAITAGAGRVSNAVGACIVSLQAGDSARQRLDHVRSALLAVSGDHVGVVPDLPLDNNDAVAPVVLRIQGAQLVDAIAVLDGDIDVIDAAMSALSTEVTDLMDMACSPAGIPGGNLASSLDLLRKRVEQASLLIAQCEEERQFVDASVLELEQTMQRFRTTISDLDEAVIDIILIGMNAGLKASHLGTKGQALVAIANELKTTADVIAQGAALLNPLFNRIDESNATLRSHRSSVAVSGEPDLEGSILSVLRDIERGNGQLAGLLERLGAESSHFMELVGRVKLRLADVRAHGAAVAGLAKGVRFRADASVVLSTMAGGDVLAAIEGLLWPNYTMASEREIHCRVLRELGLLSMQDSAPPSDAGDNEVLFF